MIMMGPKKDKGAMILSIMEKFKKPGHYESGKESNEKFMEKGGHDSAYEHYKPEVDAIFDALGVGDKEKFAKALKGFIVKCVSKEEQKEDKY
jgi:hypothetical protein